MSTHSAPKLSAIILAAGFSSRMEAFKPLLPCCDKSMVESTIDLFKNNYISDIVVVTGHKKHMLEPVIKKAGVRPVFNPDFKRGMLSSVQTGVKNIRMESDGFFLIPVDIPAIRPNTIRHLINEFNPAKNNIIIPYFNQTPGHPPLIHSTLKKDILGLEKGAALRDLLLSDNDKILKVSVHDRGILMDADDKKGYETICKKIRMQYIPDKEECLSIINDNLPEADIIRKHLADVSMAALKLAHAVEENLDTDLIIAAALLHDIKRKEKNHAQKGAELVRSIGFNQVADIIEQHMDIEPASSTLEEKEIVYFADKICKGKGIDLNYHRRFAKSLKKSPWAMASISKRYEHTQQIHARIEASAGKSVEKILTA